MSRAGSVRVYVRCRDASRTSFHVNGTGSSVVMPRRNSREYSFDGAFASHVTQREVFEQVAQPLITGLVAGVSATIFAYGQTGTGKTYTISGNPSQPGLVPRCIQEIFNQVGSQTCALGIQYIEIYNEQLYDLLTPKRERCRLVEDRVVGANVRFATNCDAALSVVEKASERRRVACTDLNADSSRSHAVLTFHLVLGESAMVSKLHLVDLAGSENIVRSGSVRVSNRQREAVSINQSLLSLGRVISALVAGTDHVPYRESKLTRLLQDSLGGSTQTAMIATVSLRAENEDETAQTLEYAAKTKRVTNRPQPVLQHLSLRQVVLLLEGTQRDLDAQRKKDGGIYLETARYFELERGSELARSLETKLRAREMEVEKLQAENMLLRQRSERQETAVSAAYTRVAAAADSICLSAGDHAERASTLESLIHELVDVANSTLTELQDIHTPVELEAVSAQARRQVRVDVSRAVESAQKGIADAFDALRSSLQVNVGALDTAGVQLASEIPLLEASLRDIAQLLHERRSKEKDEAQRQLEILEAQKLLWRNRLNEPDLEVPMVPPCLSTAGQAIIMSADQLKQVSGKVQNPSIDLGGIPTTVDNALRGVQDAAENHRTLSMAMAKSGERLKALSALAVPSVATELKRSAFDVNLQASVTRKTIKENIYPSLSASVAQSSKPSADLPPMWSQERSRARSPRRSPIRSPKRSPGGSPARPPLSHSVLNPAKRPRTVLRHFDAENVSSYKRRIG